MPPPWLIVSGDFVRHGGQDRANLALAEYLAQRGRETHVLAYRVDAQLAAMPTVRAHRAPKVLGSYSASAPVLGAEGIALAKWLGKGARVVVNGSNCLAGGAANWVHYVHAADLAARPDRGKSARAASMRAVEKIALRRARVVVANSRRTARDVIERIGVEPSRVRVIYLGADAVFAPLDAATRAEVRASLGWDARPRAVFVGALGDDRKGFDAIYAAWVRLCRAPSWDADLVVCGAGRMLDAWRARAQADGVAARVHLLGYRDDVARVVAASDFLVSAARYEPYGLNVHEALCCDVPAITTTVSGVAERYPSELAPWLVPDPDDHADVAARIERLRASLGAPIPALAALGAELRARTWDSVARDIVDFVEA